MTRLVLINGAPGSGKSTIAQALAQDRSMTLALDIDGLKHSLGRWDEDPSTAGLHARRLTLALAGEQLRAGFDLVIGQYLARPSFIGDRLVGPDDATALVQSIQPLRNSRPGAVWVDAAGSLSSTLDTVRAALRATTP